MHVKFHFSARIHENASVGVSVLTVKAFDLDKKNNGQIRYSIISDNSEGDFSIGELSGVISVNKMLDYERKKVYDLIVQAEDGGMIPRRDTASVTITIIDVNDNAPVFEHSPYVCRVMENIPKENLPMPIFQALAVDRDGSPGNKVEYSIRDFYGGIFVINTTTGMMLLKVPLDRENKASYSIELGAQDSGTPQFSSSGTLTVIVEDENDNEPRFENEIYLLSVEEDAQVGESIGMVKAFDLDEGANGELR